MDPPYIRREAYEDPVTFVAKQQQDCLKRFSRRIINI